MLSKPKKPGLARVLLCVSAVAMMAGSVAGPSFADERRHCDATIILQPTDASLTNVVYGFRVEKTAPSIFLVNQIREWISEDIVDCVRAHWDQRMTPDRPDICGPLGDLGQTDFYGYPFTALFDEMSKALCAANPGRDRIDMDFELQIRGEPRCVHRQNDEGVDPMDWYFMARNYRITCPDASGDTGGLQMPSREVLETMDRLLNQDQEGAGQGVGEGQMFENVGEGSSGGAGSGSPPPLPDPAPAATFRVLPNIRLPGGDLGTLDVADGDWRACQTACADNSACQAWTYRNRYQGVNSVCLLKRSVGAQIPDTCCRSGIKQ